MNLKIKTSRGIVKINETFLLGMLVLAGLLGLGGIAKAISGSNQATGSTPINVTVQQWISVTPSSAITWGIRFGTINASSTGNEALNDTTGPGGGTDYNFTVDSASTSNVDFYHKLNETFSNMWVNESASVTNATHGFSTNTEVDATYSIIGDASTNCSNIAANNNCWIKYYMDVGTVSSGTYERTYEYCAVYHGGSCS